MIYKSFLGLAICSLLVVFGLTNRLQKKVDKVVKSTFEVESFSMTEKVFPQTIVSTLSSEFLNNNFFEIINRDVLLGYAYVSKAPSKTDSFDYLILFDTDLVIMSSKVLAYREDYGGEIGSKRWLKQFNGKTTSDKLVYGDNIAAISGATISVKSMTNAINNVLKSIMILQQNKEL